MKKRILSIIMVLSMCLSMLPTAAFAAEDTGLCEHHPVHTEECGYAEAVAGADCTHEHTADCYTNGVLPESDADSSNVYELEGDTEQTNTLLCTHTHDEGCGYVEAVEASPCTYECGVCTVQELIDALPDEVTAENADTVAAHLDAIDMAKAELTDEELALLDLTKYTAASQAMGALAAEEVTCTCGSEDAIHATNCPVYVAPENPVCTCVEKCIGDAPNVWCDICGFDHTACTGEDTAAVYAATTYNISPENDGSTNSDHFAALIADFDGNSDPHTSGTITVTGSRESVTEAVSLTIPAGVTVNWNAALSDGGTAAGTDGLLILSGEGTLTLGTGASITSASSGITSSSFTGSVTIADDSDVTITASGSYGMSLGSASLSVGSNTTLAVSGSSLSSSSRGIYTSGTFTVGGNTHIVIKGNQPTSYPASVSGDYYRRAAASPDELATAKFVKNEYLSGARSLEIITADHIDPNNCFYEDESVHSFTCVTGCPIKVNNATADHVYDDGSNTCSVCNSDVYNVWVGGVRVTGGNKADVLGTADEGSTVVFTPATDSTPAILTLNGAAITGVYQGASSEYGIFAEEALTIQLEGSNSIKATPTENTISYVDGIFVNGGLTIKGTGSLTVTAGGASQNNYGIYATTVTIENSAVAAICETGENGIGIVVNNDSVTVDGGVLYAKGSDYGMSDSSTLTVKGDCHITIDGNNSPSPAPAIATDAGDDYTYYWLSSPSSNLTSAAWVKNPTDMSSAQYYQFLGGNHAEVTSTEESHTIACADKDCLRFFSHTDPEGHVDGSDTDTACDDCGFEAYDLWVGGTRVTIVNKDDVLGNGGVTYTPGQYYGTLTITGNVTVSGSYSDGTSTYGIYTTDQLLITGDDESSLTVGGQGVTYGVYVENNELSVTGGMTLNATGSTAGIKADSVGVGTNNSGTSDDTSSINAAGGSYGIHAGSVALYDANRVEATSETGVGIAHMGDYSFSLSVNGSGHLIAEGEGGALSWEEMTNLDLVMNGNCTGFWRFAENGSFESGDDSALGELEFELSYSGIPDYLEIIASGDMTYAADGMTCSHGVGIDVAAKLEYTYNSSNYTLYFSGLQPAMDVANAFGPDITNIKLTLLRDVTVTDAPLTITNDLPLDLAGFEISGSINGALLEVAADENSTSTGTLTITDSSTGKTGSITNASTDTNAVGVSLTAGTLTIGGGTITGTKAGIYLADGVDPVTISSEDIQGITVAMATPGKFAVADTGVTLKEDMFTSASTLYGVALESDGLYLKPDLSAATVSVSPTSDTYTGSAHSPTVTVTWNGTALSVDADYTVAWAKDGTPVTELKGAGEYTVTVTGTGSYTGTAQGTFTIAKKPVTATVTAQGKPYDGSTTATVSATVAADALASGDSITITGLTGTFSDANAGENKTVTISSSGVSITGTNSGCYTVNFPTTATATISKAISSITFSGYTPGRTYDGTALANPTESQLTITGAGYGDVVFTWYKEAGNTDTQLDGPPSDAGTYYVVATIPDGTNTSGSTATSGEITISAKEVTDPTITLEKTSYEYTGSAITPAVVSVKDGDNTIPASEYTVEYSDNTNVGTSATVTIKDADGGNYTVNGSTTFEIIKAQQAALSITNQQTSPAYGSTFQLDTSGGSGDGAVTWSSTGTASVDSSGNVTINGVGDFTITATKAGGANYEDATATYSGTSVQADPGIGEVSYSGSQLFNSTAVSSVVLTRTNTSVAGTLALTDTELTAGEKAYNWKFTPQDTTNYKTITGTVTLNVQEDTLQSITTSGTLTKSAYTYGDTFSIAGLTVTATYASGATKDVTSLVSYSTDLVAGQTSVELSYGGKACTVSITVAKATPDVTAPDTKTGLTYTGSAQALLANGGSTTGGTMQYSTDGTNYSATIPTGTNAGTYTVYYKVVGGSNYNDVAAQTVSVTISPKEVTTPTFDGLEENYLYDEGKEIKPTFTLKDGGTTIPAGEYNVTYSNNTAVGTATITITDVTGGNYKVSGTKTFEIVEHTHVWTYTASGAVITAKCNGTIGNCPVANKTVTITLTAPTGDDLKFTDSEKSVTVTQSPDGVFTDVPAVSYTGDRKSVGTHTASLTYGGETATVSFAIVKADQTAPTGLDKTDETLKGQKNGAITGVTNKMEYATTSGGAYTAITGDKLENLAAGTYYVRFAADANHNASPDTELVIAVGAGITVTFEEDGGSTVADQTDLSYGSKVTEPAEPTKTDYAFLGWYNGSAKWDFANDTVTGNITLTAGWQKVNFEVGVAVYENDETTPVSGATVKLMQGVNLIESATTDTNGSFTFKTHIPVGMYNIVVSRTVDGEEQSKTALIEIVDHDVTESVIMPPKGVSSTLAVDESADAETPTVVVGGIDDEAEGIFENGFGDIESEDIAKVTVNMSVAGKSEESAEGAEEIKDLPDISDDTVVNYLDVSITAKIVKKDDSTSTSTISETAHVMEIIVFFDFDGRKDVKVHRYHNGEAKTFQTASNRNDPKDGTCYLDEANDLIYIYSNQFSTFATSYEVDTSYTVMLSANGGTLSGSSTVATGTDGKLTALPNEPTRDGYTFKGWYTAATGGDEVTTSTVFSKDTTIYAQWTQNQTPPPSGGGGGGGGVSTYAVTLEDAEGGSVKSDRTRASYGSTVTLTVTPDEGYKLDGLTVTDASGKQIEVTDKGDGKYTFKMPGGKVTVKANFVPTTAEDTPCDGGADCPSAKFIDVDPNAWYHEALDYVIEHGLMGGYGNGYFGTNDDLSRAQLAQVLYNLEGKPAVSGSSPFTDVADTGWYADAVKWASANGITGGYGGGLFGPDDSITREQLATMLWRYAGSPAATKKELEFTDADETSDWAVEALIWAQENGIMQGYNNAVDPKGTATRAHVAQMLKNFIESIAK